MRGRAEDATSPLVPSPLPLSLWERGLGSVRLGRCGDSR
jgi:hypothetical protein